MNILLFGDVVGKPGRIALQKLLPKLREAHSADLVIVNVENMAHGFGITPETIQELRDAGVDVFTGGNHIWKNSKGVQLLADEPKDIISPANVLEDLPGRDICETEVNGTRVVVTNLLGEVFMKDEVRSPFDVFDELYEEHGGDDIVFIADFHAEATGEKRALSWYIDGRATALVGTHTHVPTTDAQVLPEGTAYVSDLGFCGATDSSLGMNKELVLKKVAKKIDISLEPPENPKELIVSGVLIKTGDGTRAESIERIDQTLAL